jgi:hypothetical protein
MSKRIPARELVKQKGQLEGDVVAVKMPKA